LVPLHAANLAEHLLEQREAFLTVNPNGLFLRVALLPDLCRADSPFRRDAPSNARRWNASPASSNPRTESVPSAPLRALLIERSTISNSPRPSLSTNVGLPSALLHCHPVRASSTSSPTGAFNRAQTKQTAQTEIELQRIPFFRGAQCRAVQARVFGFGERGLVTIYRQLCRGCPRPCGRRGGARGKPPRAARSSRRRIAAPAASK